MQYRVVFRPQATRDLESIAEFIAAENRRAATKLVREVRLLCRNLRMFPFRGSRAMILTLEYGLSRIADAWSSLIGSKAAGYAS